MNTSINPKPSTMLYLTICLLQIITCFSCKDDDESNTAPIDQLPPITQTGANTAGCLVNGEVLLPKGNSSGGVAPLSCQYQYVDGNYTFGLSIIDKTGAHNKHIIVASLDNTLTEGETYELNEFIVSGNSYGRYTIGGGYIGDYRTSSSITGELTITRLDEFNLIISGTFWYDAINEEGDIVEVREGRFDMHYIP